MARNRQEFSQYTKDLIAKRAGYICSFPNCHQLTTGPSKDRVSGVSLIGVAAHITAASANGPRYDSALTPEERSSATNGIWLCQTHGKLIDDNPSNFSVEDIHRWKKQHEGWIFSHLANTANALTDGISRVGIEGVGIFQKRVDIRLGRYNFVYGRNESGKTTLCEAIAAFSGHANYAQFADRFRFCRGSEDDAMIEVVVSHDNKATTVQLSQQKLNIRRASRLLPVHRIRVEIDGNIAPIWPQSLFNVINLNDKNFDTYKNHRSLSSAIAALSRLLNVDKQIILDMLNEELFLTSTFGFKMKRTGIKKVSFRVPDGRENYSPFEYLSGSEQDLAVIDILFKVLRADHRTPPWLVIFDSGFFQFFDSFWQERIFTQITSNVAPQLQAIFTIANEQAADSLRVKMTDNWIGSDVVDGLTIHRFL